MQVLLVSQPTSSCFRRSPRRTAGVNVQAGRLIPSPNVGASQSAAKRLQHAAQLSAATLADVSVPLTATSQDASGKPLIFHGVQHVALICKNLERSLEFYQGVLGLNVNPDRPADRLPYRGAWLWVGPETIHLMEVPNPDNTDVAKRPEHLGCDRHFCLGVADVGRLATLLEAANVPFTPNLSGRPGIFFRDPDANTWECVECDPWR